MDDNKNSNNDRQILRDRSELEGAFVTLVTADAVVEISDSDYQHNNNSNSNNNVMLPVAHATATAVPSAAGVGYTAAAAVASSVRDGKVRDYDHDDDDGYIVEDAVVLPNPYSTSNDDEEEQRVTRAGTRLGSMKTEQELVEIQRNNRKVKAINNAQEKQVDEANQKAAVQNFKEETGRTQTSYTIPVEKYVPGAPRQEPEFYPGTYGKEYETSEYDTTDYSSAEYETTEYKSVYDSSESK